MKIHLKVTAFLILPIALSLTACPMDIGGDDSLVSIGDAILGGKVAYILEPGDPGYVPGEQHGLIAATADQSSGIKWALSAFESASVPAPGALGAVMGTGLANTNAIIAQNDPSSSGLTTYAAGIAREYRGGGYQDWYLPSRDELNKLWINKVAIGGFSDNYYWSSSEHTATTALAQYFVNYNLSGHTKSGAYNYVRAVRAF